VTSIGVGRPAVDRLLAAAQARIAPRVQPSALAHELESGALVVDIRPADQRERDGELPGATVIDRNVLEWRLDPTSPHRLDGFHDPQQRVVIVCNEGYQSALAAATLRDIGLERVTDLAGGFQAWRSLRRAI
jgi:rhodanese-related sulfurtransferase